eukprot:717357-Prymnesium_polylepis.2
MAERGRWSIGQWIGRLADWPIGRLAGRWVDSAAPRCTQLRALMRCMPEVLQRTSAMLPEQLEMLQAAFKASDDGQGFVTLQALSCRLLPRLNISADTELCRRVQMHIFGKVMIGR